MKEESKIYKCVCGREFKNSQSINSHKSHCEKWLGPEKYKLLQEKYNKSRKENIRKVHESRTRNAVNKHKQIIEEWNSKKHYCENCGKLITEIYGSGRFCCKSCSVSWIDKHVAKETITKRFNSRYKNKQYFYICPRCGQVFIKYKREKYCSIKCSRERVLSEETKNKMSESHKNSSAYTGFKLRNKRLSTYPEITWKNILDTNSISYKEQVVVSKKKLDNSIRTGGYYQLDFLINDIIDLEIDGGQHFDETGNYIQKDIIILYGKMLNKI